MAAPRRPARRPRVPLPLLTGSVLFACAMILLVAASLRRGEMATYAPTPPGPRQRAAGAVDTITLDAADPRQWRFADLDAGALLAPPDTAGWDLAVRRFHVIVADAVADAGPAPLDPSAGPVAPRYRFVRNTTGRDTTNAAIGRWYAYSYLSHLLTPRDRVYLVRTNAGGYARLRLLGYYCPGLRPGCVTLSYSILRER